MTSEYDEIPLTLVDDIDAKTGASLTSLDRLDEGQYIVSSGEGSREEFPYGRRPIDKHELGRALATHNPPFHVQPVGE